MPSRSRRSAGLATTLTAAFSALALVSMPVASGATGASIPISTVADPALPAASPPPKPSGQHMHWYRWHRAARSLQGRAGRFGSTVVIGLESMHDLASLRQRYGFDRVVAIPELHAAQVSVDRAQLRALLAQAPSDPRIRYVSPTGPKRRVLTTPNDPMLHIIAARTNLPYEWSFGASYVDRALDLSQGNPAIVVGVIDTGVADVPDLAGKVDSRWTAIGTTISEAPAEGHDDFGHGTGVASLIAANVDDRFGMAGFGGATHVIAVRAGYHGFFFDATDAVALTKLVSLGVRIVNMSIGGQTPSEPILVDAIHLAAANGVLLIASAGNFRGSITWPARDLQPAGGGRSYGLAVGATDVEGRRASFSDWGQHLSVMAPGDYRGSHSGVLVALPDENVFDELGYLTWAGAGGAHYGEVAGTSFAAPEVAGTAALIWAARPELKSYQVADIIKQSARREATDWTPEMGCGILDAGAALELATSRPASAWVTAKKSDGAVCTAAGDEPPTWPSELSQQIAFAPLPDRTFGEPDFAIKAKATSGLPLSFTAVGDCTVRDATVHQTAPGSCTITAAQPGNDQYKPAASVSRVFFIVKASRPMVHALAASGRWGAAVRLPFRMRASKGWYSAKATVERNGATISRLTRKLFTAEPVSAFALVWRAPKTKTMGTYRFCVVISDRTRATSKASCAFIRLR